MTNESRKPTTEEFQNWSTEKVAKIMHKHGSEVCVFPVNGTRRWFILEHTVTSDKNFVADYRKIMVEKHLEIYQLLFDHGINYLLTPRFNAGSK